MTALPLPKMTLAEFMAWENEQPDRHEFYRGETFAMVGGTARHNSVIVNLVSLIHNHLRGMPCRVFTDGMKVQLAEGVLYPDVMVACGSTKAGDELAITDPKLVIEVLSPSTEGYDKRDKFKLYRTLASLREYVLIEPAKREVEVFTLGDAGTWMLRDQTGADALRLGSIDCLLPMAEVFEGVESDAA